MKKHLKIFIVSIFFLLSYTSAWSQQKIYTSLKEALKDPSNVLHLDLSNQKLKELPQEFKNLRNLQTLNLSGNTIYSKNSKGDLEFPLSIELPNLRKLYLKNITSIQLNKDFKAPNLEVLVLDESRIESFPKLNNFPNLKYLSLNYCSISQQQYNDIFEYRELQSLQYISLAHNQIVQLGASLFSVYKEKPAVLEQLYLQGNQIKSLPTNINNVASLTTLHLQNNQLTYLNNGLGELEKLKFLYLDNNKLTTLPFLKNKSLLVLSLHHNQLQKIHTSIGNCVALRTLLLNHNQLQKTPDEIGKLINLEELTLNNNNITNLPAEIGNLTALNKLSLENNKIRTFPKSINNLKRVEMLTIRGGNAWDEVNFVPTDWLDKENLFRNDFIRLLMEDVILRGGSPNPNGLELFNQFKEYYKKDKFQLARVMNYGAWWHEKNNNMQRAKQYAEDAQKLVREDLKSKLGKVDKENEKEALATMLEKQEFEKHKNLQARVLNNIDYFSNTIQKEEAIKEEKTKAEEQAELAKERAIEAKKNENLANKSKTEAVKERIEALTAKDLAEKAKKDANDAKESANLQRNIAVGVGVLAVLLGIFALYQMSIAHKERQKSERLLLNILPAEVAHELKEKGITEVKDFDNASILFADVKGFSALAAKVTPQELIKELDATFTKMDEISMQYGLERIKTIGDCYMAVAGIPQPNSSNSVDITLAALGIQKWMNDERVARNGDFWQVRLGTHTGELVAGVIGKTKFAYDVWGSAVNLASRMESGGEVGKVNTTEYTKNLTNEFFEFKFRGELEAKNIGKVNAYFVDRIKAEFSADTEGFVPNEKFWTLYKEKFGKN